MAAILRAPRPSSHSLDRPLRHDLFRPKSIVQRKDDAYLFTPQDAERYYLYLPRNLSYCHMCVDVLRDHVQRKVCLLNNKLSEVLALPLKGQIPIAEKEPQSEDLDADNETGIWLKTTEQISNEFAKPKQILKKSTRRTKSFPPPRRHDPKKIVRFADSLGLELETVRHVIRSELPPCIPSRAFHDLQRRQDEQEQLELVPDFAISNDNFELRLNEQKVCLLSVSTVETTIYGIVCVLNLTYHKTVRVRYTVNGWKSCHDLDASYVTQDDVINPTNSKSSLQNFDKFSFTLYVDRHDFTTAYNVRNKVHFAVWYQTQDGRVFWDNNFGRNYTLSARTVSVNQEKQNWIHFL